MAKKKEKEAEAAPDKDVLDVRELRASTLGGFMRLAKLVLTEKSGLRSMALSCSQYYADEASDAVHEGIVASKKLLPSNSDAADDERVSYDLRWKHLQWDSNGLAVYAFAPLCNEEGWSEGRARGGDEDEDGGEEEYVEGGTSSPVALAQRLEDGSIRATWLGGLHRPWLDFPGAMTREEFDDDFDEGTAFDDEPAAAPALQGKEQDLYAQVVANPGDLGIREVLRDLWTARNDPRGEFAALSSAKDKSEAMLKRAAELVLEHGRAWLGPLQGVIPLSGALFGPGPFLRKAVVYASDKKAFAAVDDADEWATVEEITFANQSHRELSRAMKNLRVVGPLGAKELGPLREGSWKVEEIDCEAGKGALEALAKLELPLKRLRLRAKKAPVLAPLEKASWWKSLQRFELWLPGSADSSDSVDEAFTATVKQLPPACELAVGALTGGQRSGWMLTGSAKARRLELLRPDARLEQGQEWAKALDLKLPDTWTPDPNDDWMHFGLGATIDTGAKASKSK